MKELIIFGENEKMSIEFYLGSVIIILSILINTVVNKENNNISS